ncbi:MAG TPA: PIN domain-containing protein [Pyrinomonadaceae bacterium]|nr:PIN domain-containing protein [Pyrinomonadaceae bacterium]
MTEVFVDTSFVIALVNHKDQFHAQAAAMADLYDGRELVTTEAVLLEIGNGLARNFKAEAIEIIENFISADEVRIVPLDAELFQKSLILYKSHQDKAWGLVDCSSFIVMRELGIVDVLTVDHDFKQAGFNMLA